ncbi:sodium channel protein type 10 subunit alpha [Angomonas deanei]|uniref:Ion transport protein, putative n=1 Tax=Angomonas deanei TaxID=59799 RepID=A0A7G2CDK4_9TRYP|nr:sodium channel protein type 10 subunit alpha [Angomonas deanei]CAD2216934.1 Ion transport protein, putative [Angomonas deanei]|eukprot:EPY40727.1 sodium channel protein type 10 subunit alpha [Angomonas deanei]
MTRGDSLANDRLNNVSVSATLNRLGREKDVTVDESVGGISGEESTDSAEYYEHLLLPGPRLRYKNVVEGGRRVFERCLDCNTHKQMPLRAPTCVQQRSADELHAEHCHMAAVRSSRQVVLNALLGYARMQEEHEVKPLKRMVEVVLGQAWSCGMLLFETIDNISCVDLPEEERSWSRLITALEVQQWLLGLHVGEEQVGRATLAYVLANQKKQERKVVTKETTYTEEWQDYAFFALSPTNPVRRGITYVVEAWWFELISLIVIYAASICLAVYTPGDNNRDMGGSYNSGKYKALHILDDIFSVIFAVEMVLKWISMGVILPVGKAYFWHKWNIFDCFIVVISLVSWGMDSIFLRYLKVMRCFRILGPLRYWEGNKSMAHIALAIWDSIPILSNVCLIMLMNYIVWAILFVSMFMNKMNYCTMASINNATKCREEGYEWAPVTRNFRNWYESLLTTFEISTGAEWMDVMYSAVDAWDANWNPIKNRHPYLGLVFIAYYYLAHFVLFSLFISGVVYCYLLARNAAEGAAGISFEHQIWMRMQNIIIKIRPKSRLVPFNNAFSRGLHKMVTNIWFERFMALILTFNMVTMALEWRGMDSKQSLALDILQWIFVAIFTIEIILRFFAHGIRCFTRWAFCWDLLVMVLSYIQIGLNTTQNHKVAFNMNVLRMLRVGRFLTLVNLLTPFETYFSFFREVLWSAFPALVNLTIIYMLSVYIFAILGLHFLGYIVPYGGYIDGTYNNFQTFVNALIMVFRLSTLENWATMLRGSLDRGNYCSRGERCGPTDWAPVYYIPIVLCFYLILQSLYLAIIIDRYIAAVRMRANVSRLVDLRRFRDLWQARDPNNTLLLPTKMLPQLLEDLRLPLGISNRRRRVELLATLREYEIPDRNGKVHYYDVLLPIARRVMAMAFHESEKTAGQSYDLAWRLSERSLGSIPSYAPASTSSRTAAEYFAATYVQAAFRRNAAIRNLYIKRSELWQQGRAACDGLQLPYEPFGFSKYGLGEKDPRLEGIARGFNIPEGTTLANAGDVPLYADTAKRAPRSRPAPSTLLPVMYSSAIQPKEKRFGPDVPNAIKRGERRSDKLDRRRANEEEEREQYERDLERESAVFDETNNQLEPSVVRPASASVKRGPSHHVDQSNPNYQPPLGADPERMREEELLRRSLQR